MPDALSLSHEEAWPGRQRSGSPQKHARASRRQFRVQGKLAEDGCSLNLRLRITSPDGGPAWCLHSMPPSLRALTSAWGYPSSWLLAAGQAHSWS